MSTNVIHRKSAWVTRELDLGAAKVSGDIEQISDMLVYLLEATDSSNLATCEILGCSTVVDLSVVGADGSGNVAVAIGDKIFQDTSTVYNKDSINGVFIGYALEAVSSGATTTIMVALVHGVVAARGTLASATAVAGAEAANVVNVAIQLLDADGNALQARASLTAYLSDDANGDSVAGTAPDGGVAIGTDGLAIPLVAGKAWILTSEADGDIDLDATESGTDTWYLVLVMPDGSLIVSNAITMAA